MVVAVVAVILALAGTATAALTKKDKKKVKNIADSEITKLAPGLSVANAANATKAGNADALGGVGPSGYTQGGGHVYNGIKNAGVSTNNNLVLTVPGFGRVQFDCAANGIDTTPELVNASGSSLFALGQTRVAASSSLDPNSTTFNDGNTLALAGRPVGTTTLQLWNATVGKTATITVSNIFCFYTASAVTN
jgi:hypothetical protein